MSFIFLFLCILLLDVQSICIKTRKKKVEKRNLFSAVAGPGYEPDSLLLFGGDDTRAVSRVDLTVVPLEFQFFDTIPADLPNAFHPTGVQKLTDELYILFPLVTTSNYYFYNSTSKIFYTETNFPQSDVRDYCIWYYYTERRVYFSGGRNGAGTTFYDDIYYLDLYGILGNLSDPEIPSGTIFGNGSLNIPWLDEEEKLLGDLYDHQCCVINHRVVIYGGKDNDGDLYDYWYQSSLTNTELSFSERNRFSYSNYDRFSGVCVWDQGSLEDQDDNMIGYIYGGKNSSGPSKWLGKVHFEYNSFTISRRTKHFRKQHISPGAAWIGNTSYVFFGEQNNGDIVKNYERVLFGCNDACKFSVNMQFVTMFSFFWVVKYFLF